MVVRRAERGRLSVRDMGKKWRLSVAARSRPVDLQQVFNLLNAVDSADGFLGHLFLEEGLHVTAEDDVAVGGFNVDALIRHVGAGGKGVADAIEQWATEHGSGRGHGNTSLCGRKVRWGSLTRAGSWRVCRHLKIARNVCLAGRSGKIFFVEFAGRAATPNARFEHDFAMSQFVRREQKFCETSDRRAE